MKPRALGLLFAITLSGCAHVATLDDLPSTAEQIAFDEIAKRTTTHERAWNVQTRFEQYLEVAATDADQVHSRLEEALTRAGYSISSSDKGRSTIRGTRGLGLWEWGAVAGVYYRTTESVVQIYIRTDITQDVTGGPGLDRAAAIADEICAGPLKCTLRR